MMIKSVGNKELGGTKMGNESLPTKYTFHEFATIDKLTTYLNNQSIPIDMIVSIQYDSKHDEWVLVYLMYTI